MLKLDQDEFITQFVTTFLATWAAAQVLAGRNIVAEGQPVQQAIHLARCAWCELMAYATPMQTAPPQSATPAPALTDAQLHPRVMPKGAFEFDRYGKKWPRLPVGRF